MRAKRLLRAASVVVVAILVAGSLTWTTASNEDKAEVAEAFGAFRDEDTEKSRRIDWDSLPEEVVAWVEVPDTSIDEPIVQAKPEEPDAYLYRDALCQGAYGTPYIDCECSLDSRFVMIYGHHMSDGSVFADFASFVDESYALGHQKIILYQRDGEALELQVLAVDVVDASQERLFIDQADSLNSATEKADLRFSQINAASQLFAFATCSYQTDNSRTVVYASESPDSSVQ